ncbi:unnamed protein product [Sphagnum jensenii]|uniref:Uncharacterized protein n=1 Tax=Sphagnum jensenii TaxID=128206 RepID=A0ABP1B5B6_9BRYO
MLIKLKMHQDNVLIAIKKLKGPQSVDKPSNLQIARGQIKLDKSIGKGSYGELTRDCETCLHKHGDVCPSRNLSVYTSAFYGKVGTTGWMAPEVLRHIQNANTLTSYEGGLDFVVINFCSLSDGKEQAAEENTSSASHQ